MLTYADTAMAPVSLYEKEHIEESTESKAHTKCAYGGSTSATFDLVSEAVDDTDRCITRGRRRRGWR